MGARGGSSHRTGLGLLTLEPSGIPAAPLLPPRLCPFPPWQKFTCAHVTVASRLVQAYLLLTVWVWAPPALSPGLSITTPERGCLSPCLQMQTAALPTVTAHGHLRDRTHNQVAKTHPIFPGTLGLLL